MALTQVSRGLLSTSIVDNGNATAITIDSSENVGIGVTSPNAIIEASVTTSGSGANNNTAGSSIGMGTSATTQPIAGMRWTGASHVGISGSAFSTQIVNDTANSNAFEMYTTGSSPLVFGTAATERLRVTSAGEVLVGKSSPNFNSDNRGNVEIGGSGSAILSLSAGSDHDYIFNSGSELDILAATGQAMRFYTDGANERMRIDSSGTISFHGISGRSSAAVGHLSISEQTNNRSYVETSTTTTSLMEMIAFLNPNGKVGKISISGLATNYVTSSDYRLKENVIAMSGATDRLKQLKPSRFNFIADADTTVDGFLAHEVQDIVPEAITGAKDAVDADGNPDYQGIDQSKLVPLLVATIQELEARIEQLENN